MDKKSVLGVFELIKFAITDPDGASRNWGTGAHGLLIYSPTGHMSVSINKDVISDPSQSDSENLFDSILFYSGTFVIEGDLIRHTVTQASNPSRIGREMLRYLTWDGDQLSLVTPKEAFGTATLVWKKL